MGMKMPEGVNPNLQAMQGGVVESFFASLLDSKTPLLEKYRVYDLYNKAKEDEKIRNEFEKEANFKSAILSSKTRWFAHVINNDFAIIETLETDDNSYFKWMIKSFGGFDKFIISQNLYKSFDTALLAALSYKYTNREDIYLIETMFGIVPNNYDVNKEKGLI